MSGAVSMKAGRRRAGGPKAGKRRACFSEVSDSPAEGFTGAGSRTRTGTAVNGQWILSPSRIPISPSRPRVRTGCAQVCKEMEAAPGIEPGIKALQASALPLGYAASERASILALEVLSTLELAADFASGTQPGVGLFAPTFLYCGRLPKTIMIRTTP